METKKNLISLCVVLAGIFLPQLSNAQKITQKSTNIKINGTSTLHDWDMTSSQATFTGNVTGNVITDVRFVMKSESLKSKESAMDKNAYKALQTSKYPELTFTSNSIPTSGTSTITGNLTISNVTRMVKIPVTVTKNATSYIIKGNTKIKMSAFGIKPPTFMMGTIKTGDDLSIDININTTN